MHIVGSISGCNVGGSSMPAAVAALSAARLRRSKRACRRTYQTVINSTGIRYSIIEVGSAHKMANEQNRNAMEHTVLTWLAANEIVHASTIFPQAGVDFCTSIICILVARAR